MFDAKQSPDVARVEKAVVAVIGKLRGKGYTVTNQRANEVFQQIVNFGLFMLKGQKHPVKGRKQVDNVARQNLKDVEDTLADPKKITAKDIARVIDLTTDGLAGSVVVKGVASKSGKTYRLGFGSGGSISETLGLEKKPEPEPKPKPNTKSKSKRKHDEGGDDDDEDDEAEENADELARKRLEERAKLDATNKKELGDSSLAYTLGITKDAAEELIDMPAKKRRVSRQAQQEAKRRCWPCWRCASESRRQSSRSSASSTSTTSPY